MLTFWKITENMSSQKPYGEDEAVDVVRNGLNIRDDFWDDFIVLCGDSHAMSKLLDVPPEKISGWASKIQDLVTKINQSDGADTKKDDRSRSNMINTGNMSFEPIQAHP